MATKAKDTASKPTSSYDEINPPHYIIRVKTREGHTVELETVDLIEALCPQDAHLAHAYTYLTRAGRKPQSSYTKDLMKAAWWIIRALRFHGQHVDVVKEFGTDAFSS